MQQLPERLQPLATMLVKEGTVLGGLTQPQRDLALAMVWSGLPASTMSEREVNEALKLRLGGPARCLSTDHVELRRWLIDVGFLDRDGYGREYRRVARAALPEVLQPLAQAFEGIDTDALAEDLRNARDAARQAKREAWESKNATMPT